MEEEYSYQRILNRNLQDLNPLFVGEAQCSPGLVNTASTSENCCVWIHYVRKGYGNVYTKTKAYRVCPGEGFIFTIGDDITYIADKYNPWEYEWVGFNGRLAWEFTQLPPVFKMPEGVFPHLKNLREYNPYLEYQLASDLFLLYTALLKQKSQKRDAVHEIVNYIQNNYMNEISMQEIADHVGLSRTYMSRLFKRRTGYSVQEQILSIRMNEARRYLALRYSVKEAANLSGFRDVSNFSKLFKREQGLSPTEWKSLKKNEF